MTRPAWTGLLVASASVAACGEMPAFDTTPDSQDLRAEATPSPSVAASRRDEPPPPRPPGRMKRDAAERYALALVNHDRAREGLPPVRWDPVAARAAERHATDLATHGFTAHVGTDGSVPEQRYTEAGGVGLVMENAGCFADPKEREIDASATFTAASIEKIEAAFVNEKPPADGHRRNILAPHHTSVGLALVQTKRLDMPCLVQEFVDDYGTYLAVPRHAKVGAVLRIAGELRPPARVAGIGISRIERSRAKSASDLARTGGYAIPKPYVTFFPRGFRTSVVLDVTEGRFSIDAPLSDGGRPGLYGVSVWAQLPGSSELVMVSLRTIEVE